MCRSRRQAFVLRSFFIIPIFLLISFTGYCQSLSSTWLVVYFHDNPGDRRVFYYRFYLQQKEDSVFGICEVLDALSNIKGISPDESTATASYKVYNNNFVATLDSSRFSLTMGEQLNASPYGGQASLAPAFLSLNALLLQNKMISYGTNQ